MQGNCGATSSSLSVSDGGEVGLGMGRGVVGLGGVWWEDAAAAWRGAACPRFGVG